MSVETTLLICIAAGLLISFIIRLANRKNNSTDATALQQELNAKREELASVKAQLDSANNRLLEEKAESERQVREERVRAEEVLKKRLEEKQEEVDRLRKADDDRHQANLKSQQEMFEKTISDLKAQVKSATEDLLQERQKEFSESSSKNLNDIVNPLKEEMQKMQKVMSENKDNQTVLRTEIKNQMENMVKQSVATQKSAEELTNAFKHQTKLQGDWGETILSELLESQGFKEGINFKVQHTIQDERGNAIKSDDERNMRPDVVLHLEANKDIIIDSKVSVSDFIRFANAANEEEAKRYLECHVKSIEKHVDELARKDYSKYHDNTPIDFVIMFVPISQALWSAMRAKPTLWREAMDKRVFIADEQTLYAALRVIQATWTKIEQEKNNKKIFDLAQQMIDRVGLFLKEYENIGKMLKEATDSFENGQKKLKEGGQSILTPARKLLKMGLNNKKTTSNKVTEIIPSTYLEQDSAEEIGEIEEQQY